MVQMFMRDLKKVSALERFCYKGFLRNSSGTKFFVRLREVSALEDVRFREVPLYFASCITRKHHFLFMEERNSVFSLFLSWNYFLQR